MPKRKKILFITPYPPGEAPSQRFRFEQYFDVLRSQDIDFSVSSFLTHANWRVFYGKGNALKKAAALLLGFWRRTTSIIAVREADFIFVHREASPVGPPIFEWIIAKVLDKKIIYDFDDALWLTDRNQEPLLTRIVKWRGKISTICKWSYRVSCGNAYLAAFAKQFNESVTLNPTTIDATGHHNPALISNEKSRTNSVIIGWTGSHSTLKYLEILEPVLKQLETKFPNVSIVVIADQPPKMDLQRLIHIPWKEATEIEDLAGIDIGIMPLPDDEWSKGKCGFKILQYMALGIPSVSSPVGVNSKIVEHGQNGFLADSEQEWIELLSKLVGDEPLRREIGERGRQMVVQYYSVNSNTPTFLSLFE